jgi:hypothetical protein
METSKLLFWKPGPTLKLSAPEVARELTWGEEVDGLIDLPIREIIDRLKAEFPQHVVMTGQFLGRGPTGSFAATWTWQHLSIHCEDLAADDCQRLIDAIESFDCMAYEPGGKA